MKSSAIRLLKRAFQDAEIHIPGTEIKINIANETSLPEIKSKNETINKPLSINEESQTLVTQAEGELGTDKNDIQKQAQQSKVITEENNLLTHSKKTPPLKPS
ncbi:TPA: hypothetical protein JBJ82_16805 [Legionella pneumophila]|nr:hypothetical protein [Legionella pneumophila]